MSEQAASSKQRAAQRAALHAVFIDVDVDASGAGDADLARKLEEICPVDIFKATDAGVEIVNENLDECVLCELCLDAAPDGAVVVRKLYDGSDLRR